jgi:conjugal transfer pilin signal peptidase TrbI
MTISHSLLSEYWEQAKVSFQVWGRHFKKWWYFYLPVILAFSVFSMLYSVNINTSQSLKGKIFVTERNVLPDRRGEYVSFYWSGNIPYPKGTRFTKRVAGIPGDEVTVVGRDVFVNGNFVGKAKEQSKKGMPLEVIKPGKIPEGYLFVQGDHIDSLDSRYAICGLVNIKSVIGRSYLVF